MWRYAFIGMLKSARIRGEWQWRVEDGSRIRIQSLTEITRRVGEVKSRIRQGGESVSPSSNARVAQHNALWVQWNPPNAERDCHTTTNVIMRLGAAGLSLAKGEGRALLYLCPGVLPHCSVWIY